MKKFWSWVTPSILVVGFYLITAVSFIDVLGLFFEFAIIAVILVLAVTSNSFKEKVKSFLTLAVLGIFTISVVAPTVIMHICLAGIEHEFLYGGSGKSYEQLLTERDQVCARFGLTSTGWKDGDRGSIGCLYFFTGDGLLFNRDIVRHTIPEDMPSRERA